MRQTVRRLLPVWEWNTSRSQVVAQRLLHSLEYDFSTFTLDDFLSWIEAQRSLQIELIYRPMPESVFGAWITVTGERREIILCEENAPPLHQLLIILHEVAHILWGHETEQIAPERVAELSHADLTELVPLFRTMCHPERQEQDAEALATLMLEQVLQYNRYEELLALPSEETIASYFESMQLT